MALNVNLSPLAINSALGNNSFEKWPSREVKTRWDKIDTYNTHLDPDGNLLRADALSKGMAPWDYRRDYLAVPLPQLIARISAMMLFGNTPQIKHETDQDNLDRLLNLWQMDSTLVTAAQTCSAHGGVYLKVYVDDYTKRGRSGPYFVAIPERSDKYSVVPTWRNEELIRADIISDYPDPQAPDTGLYRFIEIQEAGVIRYKLFKGTRSDWGSQVNLDALAQTRGLADEQQTDLEELLITYVPNTKEDLSTPWGVSDFQGLESLFLAANESFSTTQDAFRLLQPHAVVHDDLLDAANNLAPGVHVIAGGSMGGYAGEASGDPIKIFQSKFEESYNRHLDHLVDMAFTFAGISPQSVGRNIDGNSLSGYATKLRMAFSLQRIGAKQRYWQDELTKMIRLGAILDSRSYGNKASVKWSDPDHDPTIVMRDPTPLDEEAIARTIQALTAAQAISTETKVKMFHPDWTEEDQQAEVDRIQGEQSTDETRAVGEVARNLAFPLTPDKRQPTIDNTTGDITTS